MKGIQNKKGLDLQKPVQVPSCVGKMVDLFDFNTVASTKLLTEKPNKESHLAPRNCSSDVNISIDQTTMNKQEKQKQKKEKQGGKPMRKLIEEEMWRETETNHKPPSVVVRLMGLNEFPEPETENSRKNKNSNSYERKMELIRQKFAEAKQLATNEKLFHSREFQDTLQFLSSNRDLFVKFLEEPNSLFANSTPISPEIKHITVLKPSEKIRKLKNGHISYEDQDRSFENSRSKPPVPTQIVVLKPSLDKTLDGNNNKSIYEESSFNKSESVNLYGDEMSDLDVYTPTSGRSWDFNSRIESPVSLSSHESRVVREAKKRLVERWEMVASNSNSNLNREENEKEEKKGGMIISTLGEMLTIHEIDKKEDREEERENMTRELSRSKSLPVSFRSAEVAVPKKVEKSKTGKGGSFTWKLSNLFFSKNNNNNSNSNNNNNNNNNSLVGMDPCTSSCRDLQESGDISISIKVSSEQEPSPVSVLETSSLSDYSDNISLSSDPASLPPKALFRSPPIGSVARSLSWDNSQFDETMSPNSLRLSRLFSKADEEQDSFTFIQKLVSFSNLEREKMWFSIETPLDPSLFYEFLGYKIEGKGGKGRLLFDSVNEALVEIEKRKEVGLYRLSRVSNLEPKEPKIEFEASLSHQIWSVVRNWCTTFERLSPSGNYEVDLVAKKEVSGTKFEENKLFEMFNLNMEICGSIIEELIEEFILEF